MQTYRTYTPYTTLIINFSLVNSKEFTAKAEQGLVTVDIMNLIRSVHGFRFDSENHRLIFPLSAHDFLHVGLIRNGCTIEPLPRTVLAALQVETKDVLNSDELSTSTPGSSDIPRQINQALATFQREGVGFVLRNNGRALIADEMGLGKQVDII